MEKKQQAAGTSARPGAPVNNSTARRAKSMKITGTITDAGKQGLSGFSLVAYHGDVNLKKEKRLGKPERTGKDGTYSLTVDLARYPHGVNVRIAVLNEQSKEIWSSAIRYNVRADLVIDATISDVKLGISEYRRLTDKVAPFLKEAKLAELQPAQLAYLAGRSGITQAQLQLLVAAVQLHDTISAVSEEAFYGLLRQGLPTNLGALVTSMEQAWKSALAAAQLGNVIAPLSKSDTAKIVEALNAQKASELLRPSLGNRAGAAAAFVTVAIEDKSKQGKIAALLARHDGVNGNFWKSLRKDAGIPTSDAKKLENYAAVSAIIGNDPQLLQQIAAHLNKIGGEVTPPSLTKIKRPELSKLVEAAVNADQSNPRNGLGAKERKAFADKTADTIASKVAAAFPTAALRAELSAAPKSEYFDKYTKSLSQFFDRNSGIDLRNSLSAVLHPPSGTDPFRDIPDKSAVQDRVETIARLFRVLPEAQTSASGAPVSGYTDAFSRISRLADKGYRSSAGINAEPRAQFIDSIRAPSEEAAYWGEVHDRASAMRDIATHKSISLLQAYQQPFKVIQKPSEAPATRAGVADLRTLLGPLDMCDCEACASVTSPAAYLADILNFLRTDVATASSTPYDVLIGRRPDISHILLNCDNANREVPYIDLVNELLEDEVLRTSKVKPIWDPYRSVRSDIDPKLLDEAVSDDALKALRAKRLLLRQLSEALPLSHYGFDTGIDVSAVTQFKNKEKHCRLYQYGWLIELRQPVEDRKIQIDYVSRQTYGTQQELAANPSFRNAKAAELLDGVNVKYPLSLPPALPLVETRLFLDHLQVPRERLIRLLAPEDADGWATEYLGLSAAEADIIATDPTPAPFELWGFHAPGVTNEDALVDPADSTKLLTGAWSERLRRVDVLIARAGISYIELLDLLVTDFLNPAVQGVRPITIELTDKSDPATCDLSKLDIRGSLGTTQTGGVPIRTHVPPPSQADIGAPGDLLDRLARFLRLKRRTGWTTPELDLAIRQVRPSILDRKTLLLLAHLKWLKSTLRLSHAEACALWGAIDTTRYIDHGVDDEPTLPSQYEQLFLNRAVTNPVDRNFALNDTGDELRNPSLALATGTATVATAFEIGEPEVILLASQAGINKLNLQALSDIYRRVLFARGFQLSIQELNYLEQLYDLEQLHGGLPKGLPKGDQIRGFVENALPLLRSKLSITEAWFLLAGTDAATAYLMPRDEEIVQTLGDLRDQLQKIAAEHPTPDPVDTDGAALRKRLGELDWGAPLLDKLVSLLDESKLFSVQLPSLPSAVYAVFDPAGIKLVSTAVPKLKDANIDDVVSYDNGRLRALRVLTRSDRKRLLLASANSEFQNAVEQLFAGGKLSYDSDAQMLTCRGVLPAAGIDALDALNHGFANKLTKLFDPYRQLLTRKLRYRSLPQYEVDLDAAIDPSLLAQLASPEKLALPADLAPYMYIDSTRKVLIVRGQPTDGEWDAFKTAWKSVVTAAQTNDPQLAAPALPSQPNAGTPAVNQAELRDLLISAADVDALFDPPTSASMPATTAEIAGRLLDELTPFARDVLQGRAVVGAMTSALSLATAVTKDLIGLLRSTTPTSAGAPPPSMADAFLTLSASDARTPVDPGQYSALFDDYRRLSKVALLFQRLELESSQLSWVFDYASSGKWLDATDLTSTAATGSASLSELSDLVRLFGIAGLTPYNVKLIDDVLRLANDKNTKFDELTQFICDNTAWHSEDVTNVCKYLSLSNSADLLSANALDDLRNAMQAIGQIGATAEQAKQLTNATLGDDDAVLAKSLAKVEARSRSLARASSSRSTTRCAKRGARRWSTIWSRTRGASAGTGRRFGTTRIRSTSTCWSTCRWAPA